MNKEKSNKWCHLNQILLCPDYCIKLKKALKSVVWQMTEDSCWMCALNEWKHECLFVSVKVRSVQMPVSVYMYQYLSFFWCLILFQQQTKGHELFLKKVTCINNMRLLWAVIKGRTFCLAKSDRPFFCLVTYFSWDLCYRNPTTVLVFHLRFSNYSVKEKETGTWQHASCCSFNLEKICYFISTWKYLLLSKVEFCVVLTVNIHI